MRSHRNHSFSSLSTTNYDTEIDNHLDEDTYDLNLSVSSLAKLSRKKPEISTILKLNLIVVLIISLFIKLTVVSIINGSLSAFLAIKLATHGLILFTFIKNHYISLQLLFVLDIILFVIFLLFEFLLLVSNFAVVIIQHKKNKNLGFIGIWLMIVIAAIDLLILVMVAIVLENYRKPKQRLQQLEAKMVTVVHNGRLLASQMCKSGSYLLGFVCNSSNVSANQSNAATNAGMLANGTPRFYRDADNPTNRISCIDTQDEGSSFSLNDDEYVHYSSVEMNNELENGFHSFSDFYNFNNRSTNQIDSNIGNNLNVNQPNNHSNSANPSTIVNNNNLATAVIPVTTSIATNQFNNQATTQSVSSSFVQPLNSSISLLTTSNVNQVTSSSSNSATFPTTFSNISLPIASSSMENNTNDLRLIASNLEALKNINGSKEQTSRSAFERANTFDCTPSINGNCNIKSNEDESTFVHMYQSNVDEDGDPVDGPLRCTRKTLMCSSESSQASSSSSSNNNTIVQMNRNIGDCVLSSLNCKPVYI